MKLKYYDWHKNETGYMDIICHFLKSDLVLDVGCGTGWVGKCLRDLNQDTTIFGLDIDPIGLKEAKKKETPILGDANKLPFNNVTFDGIIAKDVIEHTLDALSMIQEFNRILKTGGKIYISVPDVKCKTFWDDYTHIRPFNKKSLIHLVEDGGLTVDKLWYSMSCPGLGVLMRILNMSKTPAVIKFLAAMGINRQNIHIVAIKK